MSESTKNDPNHHVSTVVGMEDTDSGTSSTRNVEDMEYSFRKHRGLMLIINWKWEIFACTGSLITFIFTLVFLHLFDGKAQPEWPTGVTLNSVLSGLSMAIKALLMVPVAECISQLMWISYSISAQPLESIAKYDAASRGAWGSIDLLWTRKARGLVCIGAILTLLSTGIDPTMQQTLSIRTRVANQSSTASLPRAYSFQQFGKPSVAPNSTRPDLSVLAILYGGLFDRRGGSANLSSSLDVLPTCSTGNCTYPVFTSLAICSRCENMTAAVENHCHDDRIKNPDIGGVKVCFSNLPDKVDPQRQLLIQQFLPKDPRKASKHKLYRRTVTCRSSTTNFTENGTLDILNIRVIRGETKADNTMPVHATACTLSFCTKRYQTSVTNGKLEEKVIGSESPHSAYLTSSNPDTKPYYTWQDSAGLNFTIDPEAQIDFSKFLQKFLNFTDNERVVNLFHINATASREQWKIVADKTQPNSTDVRSNSASLSREGMIDLFTQDDTEHIISGIARGLSTYIRSHRSHQKFSSDGAGHTARFASTVSPVEGVTHSLEVFVAVQWAWLAFPGAHLVLTWSFFIMVVISSRKNNVSIWKSSPLALLYHGLDDDVVQELRGAVEVNNLERTARNISVQLKDSGSGLHLDRLD